MAGDRPIVFPTDFSQASYEALRWVREMAAQRGGEVRCIHVIEQPLLYGSLEITASPQPALDAMIAAAHRRMREWLAGPLGAVAPRVRADLLTGRAADEIVGFADDCAAALIVMTTHGYGGLRHLLLGSTTEEVLRRAPCPVLVIRSRGPDEEA